MSSINQICFRVDFWCYVTIDGKRKLFYPNDKVTLISETPFSVLVESVPIGVLQPINLDDESK